MNDSTAQPRPPEGRQLGANGNSDPTPITLIQDERRESPLTHYLQVLLRRRWFIVATVLLAVTLAVYINATTIRLYRSTGSIEIARETARVIDADDGSAKPAFYSQEFYQTQYGLLKSRALAELVVRKLNLTNNQTFMYGYSALVAGLIWYARRVWQVFRVEPESQTINRQQRAAAMVIIFVIVHSAGDYPLRTDGFAVYFAMLCAMLTPPIASRRHGGGRIGRASGPRIDNTMPGLSYS